ncbi:hypothetical protein Mapa_013827 [Marchantia paleacea]|nr:hypothetical protein Mapa_013827 [Marchantia paleacea]
MNLNINFQNRQKSVYKPQTKTFFTIMISASLLQMHRPQQLASNNITSKCNSKRCGQAIRQ